ncbi:uncharacterized protein CBL_04407 [Carabus blaptoides fortunei]
MCGIFCAVTGSSCPDSKENLETTYEKCKENVQRRGPDANSSVFTAINEWNLLLASSVLWLQGTELTKQPIQTEKSWFLYNGDIFDSDILSGAERQQNGDTKPLLNAVENSLDPMCALSKMRGPFAFILIDKRHQKLYFARDTYGRRSLLIGHQNNQLVLTSVAVRHEELKLIELPALGIFCIDLTLNNLNSITLSPWRSSNQDFSRKLLELQDFLQCPIICTGKSDILNDSVVKVNDSDCVLLKTIEDQATSEAFAMLLTNDSWLERVQRLDALLCDAIGRRIANQPAYCNECVKQMQHCEHSLVGVLFSGGLDCAILALLADKYIATNRGIDLMNIAFEKNGSYETPDRLTARQTLIELQTLRPDRRWNLLEINVSREELNMARCERISGLIYPLESILDESLGCALWFAARGRTEHYVSPCRVLLVGMGADELFGGYTRHRAAYKRGGWTELRRELETDWRNISHRNLARDDRVIADHGRQLRTPYLDESVVEYIRHLHAWQKCYPSETVIQGFGDKLLLRSLAYHLGLTQAALLKKRALQFGSRIANSKENAHEKSPRL